MKKIAILMTCYNRKEITLTCLESIYKAKVQLKATIINIFLVDDASTDGTSKEVSLHFPEVNIIRGDGDLFWNRGMNLAWETAAIHNYDYYLWLNDDTILLPHSLVDILNDSKLKKNESIIAGVCKSKDGKVTYSGYNNLKEKKKLNPTGKPFHCDFFNGNVVLIPSPVFKEVGFLDTIFIHGQGDFDYGLRAKKMGINSFVSSYYVGICERHDELPKWCNPNYPLSIRWKSFRSPLGGRPKLTFFFQKKHLGIVPAVFHYFTIYLRLAFPKLWNINKKSVFLI